MPQQDAAHRLLDLVKAVWPDWDGPDHPAFKSEELDYKRKASQAAEELLSEQALGLIVERGDWDELFGRVRKVAGMTNLLYLATPSSGDLAILHADDFDPSTFCPAFVDLLHGPGAGPERLERFTAFVKGAGLPNKWTFPTYFLFLLHPRTDLFVKPSRAKWLCTFFGAPDAWSSRPSADTYRRLLSFHQQVAAALPDPDAADMIVLQSLVWVAEYQAHESEPWISTGKRQELRDLVTKMCRDYLPSTHGQQHLALYETVRTKGRDNWRDVLQTLDKGEDVTDLVLTGLLPHRDTQANRERGAWVHWAPAVTKDVRSWFEGAGWVSPEKWPAVSRAIVTFVRQMLDHPDEAETHCAQFVESGLARGFAAGMLSPILNTLAPDEWALFNSKAQTVLRYFTSQDYTTSLEDYTDASWAMLATVEESNELLQGPGLEGVRPADAWDMLCHWLVTTIKHPLGGAVVTWKVAPGELAEIWDQCREGEYIGVGWTEFPDLSDLDRSTFDSHRDNVIATRPELHRTKSGLEQLWRFARQIREGDRIVANRGTSEVLGIGTVTGPYYYVEGADFPHRLPVSWDDVTARRVNKPGWRKTVVRLKPDDLEEIENSATLTPGGRIREPPTTYDEGPAIPPQNLQLPYPRTLLLEETGVSTDELDDWLEALEHKRQIVLYGPPGTGKTWIAERLARHVVAETDGYLDVLQFHPSYAYEDFLQGLRPIPTDGGYPRYEVIDGRFVKFCSEASRRAGPCVLIIDEINRANLSRVFGELMYALEYRDREVRLAVDGTPFQIPRNVRIIGTMNTADRSIALVDHALRRRFAFIRLAPRFETLSRYHEERGTSVDGLIDVLREVNADIADTHYEIGTSFFLVEDLETRLPAIWRMEIEPYLEEYFVGQPSIVTKYRWGQVADRCLP
jgi:hypothetical protein